MSFIRVLRSCVGLRDRIQILVNEREAANKKKDEAVEDAAEARQAEEESKRKVTEAEKEARRYRNALEGPS